MELLETITYEGMTRSQIKETIDITDSTLYRHLENLLSEGLIVKEGTLYRKLRETPTTGSLLDSLREYHGQKLMDWKFRRKTAEQQQDICLQWLIDTHIKGRLNEYNMEQLESNINEAYNIFTR